MKTDLAVSAADDSDEDLIGIWLTDRRVIGRLRIALIILPLCCGKRLSYFMTLLIIDITGLAIPFSTIKTSGHFFRNFLHKSVLEPLPKFAKITDSV